MRMRWAVGLLTAMLAAPSGWAAMTRLDDTTAHYQVHLGVTPATQLRDNPDIGTPERQMHGNAMDQPDMQHVTAAIFDHVGERRITDATVIAVITPPKGGSVERVLERHETSGAIGYDGFVRMPVVGDYRVMLKIYRPNTDHPESARFVYKTVAAE